MGKRTLLCVATSIALLTVADADAGPNPSKLVIPEIKKAAPRLITVGDMAALRRVDVLSVSPDGRRFVLFVRQGDPATNDFRTGWFVGATGGGALIHVGDGGEVRLGMTPDGTTTGHLETRDARWSPDSEWIAYTLRRDGEVQLWRSKADGSAQEQVTHNSADVREFAWSEDGRRLYFTVGTPRAEVRAREQAKAREGFRYDEDLHAFTDFMLPQLPRPLETKLSAWVVALEGRRERPGEEADRAAFERARARHAGGIEAAGGAIKDAVAPPVARADGALVWPALTRPMSSTLRVVASLSGGSDSVVCAAEECSGAIRKVWWSEDGERVLIWRNEGALDAGNGFYAWSPASAAVATILRVPDAHFEHCAPAADDHLVCTRETPTRPAHLVSIDLQAAAEQVVADVNPEFRNIRLGKAERVEWDAPSFPWNEQGGKLTGVYPERAYGYILYPPDFDPNKQYPIFIEPYAAFGFDNSLSLEHPLHVYAANGFIVLNTQFPMPPDLGADLGGTAMKQLYSAELGFPHLTMLMESTLRVLESVAARGFIDERRVGIGGVSHGTFVPLHMLQKHDRIAAISISSSAFGTLEYYWATRKGRELLAAAFGPGGYEDWLVRPEGAGREFWRQIDIADHVDAIEAPILMNLPAHETFGLLRLIRHLGDAGKPYDAYIFPNETHIKWQPAHLQAIMNRNLDWFRFWLQGYEDPGPAKAGQYSRWRELRTRHEAQRARASRSEE